MQQSIETQVEGRFQPENGTRTHDLFTGIQHSTNGAMRVELVSFKCTQSFIEEQIQSMQILSIYILLCFPRLSPFIRDILFLFIYFVIFRERTDSYS